MTIESSLEELGIISSDIEEALLDSSASLQDVIELLDQIGAARLVSSNEEDLVKGLIEHYKKWPQITVDLVTNASSSCVFITLVGDDRPKLSDEVVHLRATLRTVLSAIKAFHYRSHTYTLQMGGLWDQETIPHPNGTKSEPQGDSLLLTDHFGRNWKIWLVPKSPLQRPQDDEQDSSAIDVLGSVINAALHHQGVKARIDSIYNWLEEQLIPRALWESVVDETGSLAEITVGTGDHSESPWPVAIEGFNALELFEQIGLPLIEPADIKLQLLSDIEVQSLNSRHLALRLVFDGGEAAHLLVAPDSRLPTREDLRQIGVWFASKFNDLLAYWGDRTEARLWVVEDNVGRSYEVRPALGLAGDRFGPIRVVPDREPA